MKKAKDDNYYMNYAVKLSAKANCIKGKVGAILVKNNTIVAEGVNSVPNGITPCTEETCIRKKLKLKTGEKQELCFVVHAEQNAIISASREKMLGATLYLVGKTYTDGKYVENSNPCALCKRMIINAGIKDIYLRDSKNKFRHVEVASYIEDDESLEGIKGY